jgi:hypothetical protein
MPTIITNVTELQAMEDDLDEDYVLGNNIDASATSGWNGGLGFDPIGNYGTQYSYSRPWDDDFGYAGQSGSWTIYPSDGVYYSKVDEETSDSDVTYIQATANNSYCLLAHHTLELNLPDNASDIVVRIKAIVRNTASGTSYIQGMLNIDGTEYLVGSNIAVSSQSYATKTWTMLTSPATGWDWTIGSVFNLSVQGVGVKVSDASPNIRITQIWIQVEYTLPSFTGTFDGNGYTISDLYINRPTEDNVGLFGYTDEATTEDVTLADFDIIGANDTGALIGGCENTTITDVIITGVDITGGDDVGGLIGYSITSTITNCSVSGSITGDEGIGGLIGLSYSGTITESYSSAVIVNNGQYAGGLLGYSSWDLEISDCYATGNVSGVSEIGGLIGYADNVTAIYESYATGNVVGTGDYIGGLIGDSWTSIVYRCYATGTINGVNKIGGLIGIARFDCDIDNCYARGNVTGTDDVGGLIGHIRASTLDNAYSTGVPSGTSDVGGLIGLNYNDASIITNCFWDTETSGTETSDGGTGKTTALMKVFATFHDATWNIGQALAQRNDGYPFLSWEISESATIWQIFGEGTYETYGVDFDFPDLMDDKGRHPKNARVVAYRTDVHSEPYLIEEQYTDHNGTATFTKLPIGQDIVFHAIWGGKSGTGNEEWFFLRVNDIEDGGTGSGTAAGALDNLGVHAAAIMWELVLGD